MAGFWQTVQSASKALGRLLGILRKIPLVDDAASRAQSRFLNPVVTRVIRDPDDPDLDAALDLYRKKIPDDQRFETADIVRWLREDADRRSSGGPSDWFIVAKYRRKVCGFVLFHYYPSNRLAFFAYMVASTVVGLNVNAVSRSLMTKTSDLLKHKKELQDYRGFLSEVEDPRKEASKRKREESLARIRRFCTLAEMQGFTLRAFDIEYKQPKLSLEPTSTERPMLLLFARRDRLTGDTATRKVEAVELLKFVYTSLYPEGFSADEEENREYRQYCEDLFSHEAASLPQKIKWIGCPELAAKLGRKTGRGAALGETS